MFALNLRLIITPAQLTPDCGPPRVLQLPSLGTRPLLISGFYARGEPERGRSSFGAMPDAKLALHRALMCFDLYSKRSFRGSSFRVPSRPWIPRMSHVNISMFLVQRIAFRNCFSIFYVKLHPSNLIRNPNPQSNCSTHTYRGHSSNNCFQKTGTCSTSSISRSPWCSYVLLRTVGEISFRFER